jgi:hypothetical protein
MVAVPLTGKHGTIGLIQAFSNRSYAFQDSNIRSLNLLAELILAAMKPEKEKQNVAVLPEVPLLAVAPPAPVLPQEPVPAEPVVAEINVEEISENISPPVAEPVPARHFQIEKPKYSAYPGLKIVVGLVLLAILAGAGIWWKLYTGRAIHSSTVNTSAAPVSQTTHQDTPAASSQNVSADKTDEPARVTDIRSWSSAKSSTVVIELQDSVRYEEHRLSAPDRIYFDLPDTTLVHKLVGKVIEVEDSSFLLRVRVAQPTPGTTRVVLDTKNNPGYTVRMDQAPYRLTVEVHSADAPAPFKANLDLFAPAKPPGQAAIAKPPVAIPNSTL